MGAFYFTLSAVLAIGSIRKDDAVPAVLIILVVHSSIAVRCLFIKILSDVIKHHRELARVFAGDLTVLTCIPVYFQNYVEP